MRTLAFLFRNEAFQLIQAYLHGCRWQHLAGPLSPRRLAQPLPKRQAMLGPARHRPAALPAALPAAPAPPLAAAPPAPTPLPPPPPIPALNRSPHPPFTPPPPPQMYSRWPQHVSHVCVNLSFRRQPPSVPVAFLVRIALIPLKALATSSFHASYVYPPPPLPCRPSGCSGLQACVQYWCTRIHMTSAAFSSVPVES